MTSYLFLMNSIQWQKFELSDKLLHLLDNNYTTDIFEGKRTSSLLTFCRGLVFEERKITRHRGKMIRI